MSLSVPTQTPLRQDPFLQAAGRSGHLPTAQPAVAPGRDPLTTLTAGEEVQEARRGLGGCTARASHFRAGRPAEATMAPRTDIQSVGIPIGAVGGRGSLANKDLP